MEKKKNRAGYWAWAILILFILPVHAGAAEPYPAKPIKLLIPFAPGGGTDLSIRIVEKVMPKYLNQRLVLVNRPGGQGSTAMTELVNSKPDGYTICVTAPGPTTTVPHMEKVSYGLEDYVPIIQLTNLRAVLVAHPETAFKSLEDVLGYAKKNPPGALKVAIAGIGSPSVHLPLVMLEKQAGVKFSFVPFKSGGETMFAVMGKHAPVGNLDLLAAGPRIKSGALKPIGLFSSKRSEFFPHIPTVKEQGYDIETNLFNMIAAPKGVPENVVQVLHDAFKKALEDPELLAAAKKLDLEVEYLDTKACRERINRDYQRMGALIESLGLRKKDSP